MQYMGGTTCFGYFSVSSHNYNSEFWLFYDLEFSERLAKGASVTYLFTHHMPVSVLDTGITQRVDQWHVDLKLLQFGLDGCCSTQGPLHVGMSEGLGQAVGKFPQLLNLKKR